MSLWRDVKDFAIFIRQMLWDAFCDSPVFFAVVFSVLMATLTTVVLMSITSYADVRACESRGGVYVRTASGYACMRDTRI